MKRIITIFLFFMPIFLYSQEWKRHIFVGIPSFVSGFSWGIHEKLMNKYPTFQSQFPNANPKYWNPDISWKNKYKNGDPSQGRNLIPVQITDGKHLTATINQWAAVGTGITIVIGKKEKWWIYGLRVCTGLISYSIGNWLAYDKK